MKEAFEKIKERLEAIWVDNRCGDCVYKSVCDKVQEEAIVNDQTDLCGVTIKAVALSIVSEVEAEYGNGWIDVKDRLPKRRELVLVCLKNGYVGEGHFTQDDFWNTQCRMYENVIAWMPLPLPYQPQKGV